MIYFYFNFSPKIKFISHIAILLEEINNSSPNIDYYKALWEIFTYLMTKAAEILSITSFSLSLQNLNLNVKLIIKFIS